MASFLVEYEELGNAAGRTGHRERHIGFRKGLGADLVLAAALLDADGQAAGSVVIVQAEDAGEAGRIAAADPYVLEGVFAVRSVRALRVAAINPAPAG